MKGEVLALLKSVVTADGLPNQAKTRSGAVFDPALQVWDYRDGTTKVCVDFNRLPALSERLLLSVKRTMVHLGEQGSPGSLSGTFTPFVHFAAYLSKHVQGRPLDVVTSVDYLNFRSTPRGAKQAAHVKIVLRTWHELGLPGLAHDLISTLDSTKEWRHTKGVAVTTMDPIQGPFTDIELQAIQSALNEAYARSALSTGDFVLAWLFMALGSRPAQFAAMKVRDVHVASVGDATDYSIDVPRVKQKRIHRTEFMNRPLTKRIGELVARYACAVRSSFEGVLHDASYAPLFPAQQREKDWALGFEYHLTPENIGGRLAQAIGQLQVISERTGKAIHATPVRFRRTFGTRAAQEGHGVLVIAELLDHSDTQNAGIYVEARPDLVTRIDKAVALELAPLAQAFKGKLIRAEFEATRSGDPSSRIRDLRVDDKTLASCGQHSFCGMSAPIACYTCSSFEPWIDGPHEALLDSLIAKRGHQLASVAERIATIHDRTILAVAQVVQMCAAQKAQGI